MHYIYIFKLKSGLGQLQASIKLLILLHNVEIKKKKQRQPV